MKFIKPRYWDTTKFNILPYILLPFSILILLLAKLKNTLIKENVFRVPIICIGNIYLGGTGKTPLSHYISEFINVKLKKKTAIIKKFYKDQLDEINLLEGYNQKVITSSSRISAIKNAIKKKFAVIVMDDGLQDNSIKKDLKIVCFTSEQGMGNGFTIPSGPLRESINALNSCQIAIINGKKNLDLEKRIKKKSPKIKIFYSYYSPINTIYFKGRKLFAFAGIGNSKNFFKTIEDSNLIILKKKIFPDHFIYSKNDYNRLKKISKDNNLKLITTEKDFYRLKKMGFKRSNVLKIKLKIKKEKELIYEIKKYI